MKKLSVIIARFQVPELTDGHRHLFNSALNKADDILVLLGVPAVLGRKKHPLTFQMREAMLREVIRPDSQPRCAIAPLPDIPNDDKAWATQVDRLIGALFPMHTATIWGSRDSALATYISAGGRHPIHYIEPHPEGAEPSATGTETRAALQPIDSYDFRAGVIWGGQNRHDAVMPVVDMAVFGKSSILLARKATDPGDKWRLIGGFVDAKDPSYEAAAAREVREETGLEIGNVRYAGSCAIDDARYRGGPETVKSAVFIMDHIFGRAVAADDIAEVKWFPVHEAMARISPFHEEALALAIKAREAQPRNSSYPPGYWMDFVGAQEVPAS